MYSGVFDIFKRYWTIYGGWNALLRSPYFHFALVMTGVTFSLWIEKEWPEIIFKIIPNLLGFSLGGFAIFFSLGDSKFQSFLVENEKDDDPNEPTIYLSLCASFVHFLVIQAFALIYALVFNGWSFGFVFESTNLIILKYTFSFFGFFLFLYALVLLIALVMHIFRISSMYSQYKNSQ